MGEDDNNEKNRFDDMYWVRDVCPYCNHSNYVEIVVKSGFFDIGGDKEHYKCSRCSREFKRASRFLAVPDVVHNNFKIKIRELVQSGLDGKITQTEMAEGFKKLDMYIHIPYKSKIKELRKETK